MRPSVIAEMRSILVAPGVRTAKSVPTTRRAKASSSQRHAAAATSPSASSNNSTPSTSSSSSSSSLAPPPPLSSPFLPFGSAASTKQQQNSRSNRNNDGGKIVWVQPFTAEAAQAASESGVRVQLFDEADAASAADFAGTLARFDAVVRFGDGLLADVTGRSVGVAVELRTPADVRRAEALASSPSPSAAAGFSSKNSDGGSSDAAIKNNDSSEDSDEESVVLADARDWAIIPAENLVAAFQEARRRARASWEEAVRRKGGGGGAGGGNDDDGGENSLPEKGPRPTPRLLVTASTADGALALLGALESGVDGVVLRTGDPREVRALCAAVEASSASGLSSSSSFSSAAREKSSDKSSSSNNSSSSDSDSEIEFEVGVVSSVTAAGMGDRVCVDVTVLLEPGEGLLVGSFAAAALLVHSEREGAQGGDANNDGGEAYISPRPFRVNAGAVHSYVAVPRGRTAYLSELKAGSEVLVVRPPSSSSKGENSATTTRAVTSTAVVGRAKVERRPMIKVDVRLADGSTCSAVLQNAETVRVVAPNLSRASLPPAAAKAKAAAKAAARPPLPRRRRLGAEDEEALRWAMEPSSSAAFSSSSSPEKLAVDAEKTLEWVMGPSESSSSYPSSHPLSPSSSSSPSKAAAALSATPTWSATSSSSSSSSSSFDEEDGNESDGAEELVEGPPRRPYLLPRNDSRAVAALRWLLGVKRGAVAAVGEEEEEAAKSKNSSSSSSSSSPLSSSSFPSDRWDPRETRGWTTVAVTDLVPGQPLLVRRAAAARHTGIEIDESIVER